MEDPFAEIRARMRLLEEPFRAQRELTRALGGTHFASESLERLESFRAFEQFERERTASRLAAAGLDALGLSRAHREFERELALVRLHAVDFDRLRIETEERRRYLDYIKLYDPQMFERASVASQEFAKMRELFDRTAALSSVWQDAQRAAELASEYVLPDRLAAFRASEDVLALRLAHGGAIERWREPAFLSAFGEASAFTEMLSRSDSVTRELIGAGRDLLLTPVPGFASLADYRQFLDAAGLSLPRIPKVRAVTKAEKRRRIRARLQRNGPPPHVKRARTLVHKYELTLRDSIDAAMAAEFGDDWAEQRLVACDCKDLLGRWHKRGGEPLDHADYAHYERIMGHPDHYEAVFARAFDDPDQLRELIARAGRLRAASHHPHVFTEEDLRELRLTWRTIELGLAALIDDFEIESWG